MTPGVFLSSQPDEPGGGRGPKLAAEWPFWVFGFGILALIAIKALIERGL
jgi:hypothetical protein